MSPAPLLERSFSLHPQHTCRHPEDEQKPTISSRVGFSSVKRELDQRVKMHHGVSREPPASARSPSRGPKQACRHESTAVNMHMHECSWEEHMSSHTRSW